MDIRKRNLDANGEISTAMISHKMAWIKKCQKNFAFVIQTIFLTNNIIIKCDRAEWSSVHNIAYTKMYCVCEMMNTAQHKYKKMNTIIYGDADKTYTIYEQFWSEEAHKEKKPV